MKITIPNGTTVSRLHSDGDAELLAAFQYESHAEAYVLERLREDETRGWTDGKYVLSFSSNGTVKMLTRSNLPKSA